MLEISNLSIKLGAFTLRQVSLSVAQGQYLCLAGPTGAGKTILLECIAGLHRPDSGNIHLQGRDITKLPPEARGIGYVPQDYALFPHMSVFENIAYGLRERGVFKADIKCKVQEAAQTMQIAYLLERTVLHLSGGERQRTAFARALVLDCKLLLLDESLSALDVVTTRELSCQIAELHQRLGLTVIHVTHDFDEAYSLATHLGICYGGRLLQVDTVENSFLRPTCRTVAEFLGIANVFPRPGTAVSDCPLLKCLDKKLVAGLAGRAICIRSDQISISNSVSLNGALSLPAVVRGVRWLGPLHEVVLDIGVPLVVTLSGQEQSALRLLPGDNVYAHIPGEALHCVTDE
jgi:ABC-type sugar transport system ATPase subunit